MPSKQSSKNARAKANSAASTAGANSTAPTPHLYRVLYTFKAQSDLELSCQVGDILITDAQPRDNWLIVTKYWDLVGDADEGNDPKRGYVPVSFIERMTPQQESKFLEANGKAREDVSKKVLPENAQNKQKEAINTVPNKSHSSVNDENAAHTQDDDQQEHSNNSTAKKKRSRNEDKETSDHHVKSDTASARIGASSRRLRRQNTSSSSTSMPSGAASRTATNTATSFASASDTSYNTTSARAGTFSAGVLGTSSRRRSLLNSSSDGVNAHRSSVASSYKVSSSANATVPSTSRLPDYSRRFGGASTNAAGSSSSSSLMHQLFDRLASERNTLFDDYNQELHKTSDMIQDAHRESHELIHRIRQLEQQIDIEQNNLKAQHA
uniref:SH3 domain-containing protein n=1 Tax=Percolomonas cosmopolitus TaxID=63605 RepID=A0A7S1KNQ8_9EUKA|eukprot:CAMPEP_0117446192 /NCGR_PEP_ID=MMETSP0759-20121206/6202_1 /TAXON_ID=63605 /ORGANISM="Percolomonas cosmopolitus, Strain WS" /LENGTH=380 /DNA_ID=CAMNT_0005238427 /DNA_START=112 /DNA_END=1254 /DNA_ORIENTATION=+